tara:strand:- start:1501 stop:2400 length:900 start_codon:yes stop_codon:yes gene_type:complete
MTEWYLLMVGAIILSGIGSIIEKKTLYKEHAMEFSSVFAIVIFAFSLLLIPYLNFNFPNNYWSILYFLSILGSIGFLFVAKATRHMQISSCSPLFAFGPVMTAILAWIILSENLSTIQLGGIALVFAGSYILEMRPRKSIKKELLTPFQTIMKSRYAHFMLFAVLLYSVSSIMNRYLLNATNPTAIEPITFLFIIQAFMAINLFIMISVFHDGFKGVMHGIKSAGSWIAIMAVIHLAARLMLVHVITVPAAKIALVVALRRSSLLISTYFGGGIFKDKHLKQKTFAAVVMVIGAIVLVL